MKRGRGYTPRGYVPAVPPQTTIDLGGDWRACTDSLPAHCKVFGTVTRGHETGALVKLAAIEHKGGYEPGAFVMVRNGAVSMLEPGLVSQLVREAQDGPPDGPKMVPLDEWERGE